MGRHKARPYGWFEGGTGRVARNGEGRCDACPYGWFEGVMERVARKWAGTRPAPTGG